MIRREKGKFTRSIAHIEMEPGEKNRLMQTKPAPLGAIDLRDKKTNEFQFAVINKINDILKRGSYSTISDDELNVVIDLKKTLIEMYSEAGSKTKDMRDVIATEIKQIGDILIEREKSYIDKQKNKDENDILDKRKANIEAEKSAELNNRKALLKEEKEAKKELIAKQKNANIAVEKAKNDPVVLDANETKAYELIKKVGILDPETLKVFQEKIAKGDKDAKKDALELEKALLKDGKSLTADGKITDKTVEAARGLIGENADAILKYEQVIAKLADKKPSAVVSNAENASVEKTQ